MKAVLSNRIYLNCDQGSELDKELMQTLTYEISQEPISPYPEMIYNMIRVTPKSVSIPIGRLDLIPEGYNIIDRRSFVPAEIPEPKFTPRPNQQEAIDWFDCGGIINAKVGWGKTIAGLGVAHKLQQKTLIICTTSTIRDMWMAEIRKWFGIEPGVLGGGKENVNSPIVVGNIQTVRNRAQKYSEEFGLVILDEVHRCPAKTFTDTLNTFKATYRLGLSGTLERKDGKHCVLQDYFGHRIFKAVVENTIDPEVHIWDSEVELSANEFIPWSVKINQLKADRRYINEIAFLTRMYADAGHRVLVLSDRTAFLEQQHLEFEDRSLIVTGNVTGQDRIDILELMGDLNSPAEILYGTQSIFAEGVSVNALSAAMLATPINNNPLLEQICGRVMRKLPGKKNPVIIDVRLQGNTGKRHGRSRTSFYVSKGWKIKKMGGIASQYSE